MKRNFLNVPAMGLMIFLNGSIYAPFLIPPRTVSKTEFSDKFKNSLLGVEIQNGIAIPLEYLPKKRMPKQSSKKPTTQISPEETADFLRKNMGW